jgi:hypothetical protein
MAKKTTSAPLPLAFWILLCAFFNCVGWGLSALHQLNLPGYLVAMMLGFAAGLFWWKRQMAEGREGFRIEKLTRRFRKPFPFAFLVLAALAFLGGALHPPSNYDALAYRLPRILHWLAKGGFHWIHTDFQRLNVRAVGFEWVATPCIVFTKSDRLLFLINIISFLLLPGLIYSLFTRLGVRQRTAWYWMWLLPTAFCFVLQAGSIANDLFGAVFALAAVDFALRARASSRITDLWLSCLAAALMTGSKTSNLPLLLPWAIAILPALPLLAKKIPATAFVAVAALVSSFLPVAVANQRHCGDWTGLAAEQSQFSKDSPLFYVRQNAALLVMQNLVPPIFPMANMWNKAMLKIVPPALVKRMEANFEPVGAHLALDEMQIEEGAGLGMGVSVLVLAGLLAGLVRQRTDPHSSIPKYYRAGIVFSPFISILVYMAKSGLSTAARLVTPYYGLLLPALVAPSSQTRMVRSRWWRGSAMLVFLVAGVMVIISPARPLWPARLVLSKLGAGNNALLKRAESVYTVYGRRADGFAPIRERLPKDVGVLGLVSFDDPETSLWKPFGSLRVEHVLAGDSLGYLQGLGIKYVLLNANDFSRHFGEPFQEWITKMNGEVTEKISVTLRATRGATDWYLVKLPSTAVMP